MDAGGEADLVVDPDAALLGVGGLAEATGRLGAGSEVEEKDLKILNRETVGWKRRDDLGRCALKIRFTTVSLNAHLRLCQTDVDELYTNLSRRSRQRSPKRNSLPSTAKQTPSPERPGGPRRAPSSSSMIFMQKGRSGSRWERAVRGRGLATWLLSVWRFGRVWDCTLLSRRPRSTSTLHPRRSTRD